LCSVCKRNKVDGRKNETICPSCLETIKKINKENEMREKAILDEVREMVGNLVTPKVLEEVTVRIRSTPMHQIITKLLAYEIISIHIPSYKNGESEISLIDVFLKASELNGVIRGSSHVSSVIEDQIVELTNSVKKEMEENGFENPTGLGFISGS